MRLADSAAAGGACLPPRWSASLVERVAPRAFVAVLLFLIVMLMLLLSLQKSKSTSKTKK